MDRAISNHIQQKEKLRKAALWIGGIALLALGVFLFRSSLQPGIKRSQFRTAVAERGPILSTLTASGLVLPEFEEVLAAPLSADIKAVYAGEGTQVEPGQALLSLDKSSLLLDLEKQKSELALKRNSIQKLRFELAKSLYDLEISDSIKALNISRLEAQLDNSRRLLKIGGATQEQVEQAELELRIARLEKRQLENDLKIKKQSVQAELRESELQAEIQEHSLREMERKLAKADLSALRSGVITWINHKVGSGIREGEQLVKIADLGSYRLEGAVSDLYANRVAIGMPTLIRINDTLLNGTVTNIRPTVENDILTFDVTLENPRHSTLRPNLRVEVFIVTDQRADVVRVANGPAFNGRSIQELFVVESDRARRRRVPIGLSNFDYVELRDQIRPGELVIISDMSDYEYLKELRIVE
jgi:HlyD family secretion protein